MAKYEHVERNICRRGPIYYITFTDHNQKPRMKSTKLKGIRKGTSLNDARRLLVEYQDNVNKGQPIAPKAGRLTLQEGLSAVVNDLKKNGRATVQKVQRQIDTHLLPYFHSHTLMSTLSAGALERYQDHRLVTEKAQAATVNRELAIVRKAFRLARRRGDLLAMPHVPMLAENNVRTGFFEREQLDTVLRHIPSYIRPLIEFLYATGWRKSEAFGLTVSHVNLRAGTVRLDPDMTKTRRARTIVLTGDLLQIVKKQIASLEVLKKRRPPVICPYVFHHPNGRPITTIRQQWEDARTKAGYPTALLHDFRRSAVRNLGRAGISRSVAMTITGHLTESVYNRYDIKDETVMREAAEMMQTWADRQRATSTPKGRHKGQVKQFRAR